MHKKIKRGLKAKRRALYIYTCLKCQKRRYSRVYARAGEEVCMKCRRNQVPDNQPSLFVAQGAEEWPLNIIK